MDGSNLGLVWCPQWDMKGDGPYSIAAKMLNANNLKNRYLGDVLRWKAGLGASLLDPQLNKSGPELAIKMGQNLCKASLASLVPGLYKELADDREIRYCSKCMSMGFQAAIAQISGLERCPIHGDAYRNTCIQCGHKTPRYFLEDNQWIPGFSCRVCGAPFGGNVKIDRKLDAWRTPNDVHRLDPIHCWLKDVNDTKAIQWINISEWNVTTASSGSEDECKRLAVFGVLRTQFADKDIFSFSLNQKPTILGPYPLSFRELPDQRYEDVLQRLGEPHELRQYRRYMLTPSFGVPVPIYPVVPPELHAHLIWCAQFEQVTPTYVRFYSRLEFCRNAVPNVLSTGRLILELSLVNTSIAEGVLAAAWLVSLKIARGWNQMLTSIAYKDPAQPNHYWLAEVERWAHRLGCWRNRGYYPIGAIMMRDRQTEERQLYFTVA